MIPFRDLPIRRKVARAVLLTSTMVVFLTAAAFMSYEWVTFRDAALTQLTTIARIIADNSTAAVRFRDPSAAGELLATLDAEQAVVAAALFEGSGQRMATFGASPLVPPALTGTPDEDYRFIDGHLLVFEPIIHAGRREGTLCIVSTLQPMYRRFLLYGTIVIAILVTSTLVAFGLSRRLQRRITEPVLELAQTARAVTERQDYSMRATRYGNDELGTLTDAFNRMLGEIKERDARLSASEERLRVALAAANMGTWRYYPDRAESIVDENFRRIFALPPGNGSLALEEIAARIAPEDRSVTLAAFDRALQSKETHFSFEYRIDVPGGIRWVRDRGRVVRRDDGQIDYVTGALVDITDRKLAEEEVHRLNADLERRVTQRTAELEQANKELEAFTYSVSHDLRGPLRHIVGYTEMTRDDAANRLSEDSQGYLQRVIHAAEKLSRLVDSLLNLSRIGRRPLVKQKTRLEDVVDAAIRELESEVRGRRVEWRREPLPEVECDPGLMSLVFVNLLSNALKYTRPREVATITIGTLPHDGGRAVFIRDNGVGYDPRFQEKLFGVFERLHSGPEFEGTGVGLAIVERIVRKHGGRIWAEGRPDEGATFTFTLAGM